MTTLNLWREFTSVFPAVLTLELGRYVVAAGLVSLLIGTFWRAGLKARKIQARSASTKDYRRELLASLRTALIFAATGFMMYLAAKAGGLIIYHGFEVRGPAYLAISLVAMVAAHDTYFYWTHRAMHHPRLFRWFHRTHHKSHTPTPWTAYAFDAPEAIVMVAFVPLWVALIPMHELAIFIFMTWQIARNVLGHAGVELSPASGKPSRLFGWLNTTTHHDLHHQNARFNYGLYFSWWDRLMGTEHPDYQARVAEIVHRSVRRRPDDVVATVRGL
jgi:sterol desaturase/sphingolipid hydroxylase (fatty acid hydroxylase superfamily)